MEPGRYDDGTAAAELAAVAEPGRDEDGDAAGDRSLSNAFLATGSGGASPRLFPLLPLLARCPGAP